MNTVDTKKLDSRFKYEVAAHPGGENLKLCFACGTCTAGCPVAEIDEEFDPRKIIRQVVLGMREEVLASPVIWRCVQCHSCTAKCPQNVRFREIAKALREMAVKEGFADESLLYDVESLGKFTQRLRRDLVEKLLSDPAKFEQIKNKIKAIISE